MLLTDLQLDLEMLCEAYLELMQKWRDTENQNLDLTKRNEMLKEYIRRKKLPLPEKEDSVWYQPFLKGEKQQVL